MKWNKLIFNPLNGLALLTFASASQAAIDMSQVTPVLTDAGIACGVVGAGVLVVMVGVKAFKWIRHAL